MGFTFKKADTFAATVNVELATDDPKKPNKGSFVARFKAVDREQMKALQEELKGGDLTDETFLDKYLVGVSGIGGEDGELNEKEQRAIVYNQPALTLAVVQTFFATVTGAKAKN